MPEWLDLLREKFNNPIVQSGVAPFVAALLVAKLLSYIRLSGFAIIAAFAATVYLIADFNFDSLTIVKKIILVGLIAAAIAPLLDLASSQARLIRDLIIIASVSVILWVFWSVLQPKELKGFAIYGLGLITYIACLAVLLDRLASAPIRAGAAGMGLGASIGVSALLSASALLGQLGISIAMAGVAYLLFQFFSNRLLPCGRTFTLPLTMLCGLIAPAAMILAKLPWYCLPLFLLTPLAALIPLPENWSLRWQTVGILLFTLIGATIPVLLIMHESGDLVF